MTCYIFHGSFITFLFNVCFKCIQMTQESYPTMINFDSEALSNLWRYWSFRQNHPQFHLAGKNMALAYIPNFLWKLWSKKKTGANCFYFLCLKCLPLLFASLNIILKIIYFSYLFQSSFPELTDSGIKSNTLDCHSSTFVEVCLMTHDMFCYCKCPWVICFSVHAFKVFLFEDLRSNISVYLDLPEQNFII